ncbi:MAG: Mrp/NBP35 family ATP-binding protein [Oscillospiraceae bacterium]|nr:Mrp/NBP35 family ATP-binding protein [Oscillospiraceae bacterium]
MSECNHDCEHCGHKCSSAQTPESFLVDQNEFSNVKHVIGVVSGKGGVGKSLVTSLLAANMQKKGYRTAVLDADVTGPSIPKAFGITNKATGSAAGIIPELSKTGIEVMSVNLLLQDETEPVVWRGPVIAGTVKQFWQDVVWNDVDYMFVDMPPGTGDVPLTVFQSLPVDGIVVVTSPQELVGMIVEKAVKMAGMMDIPVLAVVENMSGFRCPDCGKVHNIFGESHIDEIAEKYGIPVTAKIPMDPSVAAKCDAGDIEYCEENWLDPVVEKLANLG